jgi:hypothetical protein
LRLWKQQQAEQVKVMRHIYFAVKLEYGSQPY